MNIDPEILMQMFGAQMGGGRGEAVAVDSTASEEVCQEEDVNEALLKVSPADSLSNDKLARRVTTHHLRTQTMIPDPGVPQPQRQQRGTGSLVTISQMLIYSAFVKWGWGSCSQLSLFLLTCWLCWPS